MRRQIEALSVRSSAGPGDRFGSMAPYRPAPRIFSRSTKNSASSLRLIGLSLATVLLVLVFASSAFAARSYVSQVTQANSIDFSNPYGLAVDGADNLWVSDIGSSFVSKFDSTGGYLAQNDGTTWNGSIYNQGLAYSATASLIYVADSNADDVWGLNLDTTFASIDLNSGLGGGCCFIRVAVDNSGNAQDGDIYVGGAGSTVTRVDGTGAASNFSATETYISANQITGTPAHAFSTVNDVAVDTAGDMYVVDASSGEVDRYDSTGTFVRAYTGTFGSLQGLAVDPTNGNVLVGDASQGVVHEFDSAGAFLGDTDGTGTPGGSFVPQSLAVDSTGTLYVSDASHPVVNVFGPPPVTHDLAVSASGLGSGTVTSAPSGINCGATCTHGFNENSTVTLTATPAAHSAFTGWTVDGDTNACPGTGTCDVPMGTADHAVVANFEVATHTLTVSRAGTGSGGVTSAPAGIDCGVTCASLFDEASSVTLTATPVAGSTFTGWSGAGAGSCPGTGTCHVTIPAGNTSVVATFALTKPTVTTTAGATGITQTAASVAGTVTPNLNNVTNCHIDYGTSISYGTQVPCSPASPGAGASAVDVTAALSGLTAGTTYHFRVVATTAGGTTNGTDQTFTTSAADTCATNAALCPPAPTCATDPTLCPKPGVLKLAATSAVVSSGKAAVKLSCKGETACTDTLKLTIKIKVKQGKRTVTKTLTLGKVTVDVAAGASSTVKIQLSRKGRNLFAEKGRLNATLTGSDLKHAIVLKKQPKKKKKK